MPTPTPPTPTPWHMFQNGYKNVCIESERKQVLAWMEQKDDALNLANAAHIVRCVNSHAALVAACQMALDYFRKVDKTAQAMKPGLVSKQTPILEAALALAGGGG